MKNDNEIRKYLNGKFDAQSQHEKLKTFNNAANTALYNTDYHETYKVNIKPDVSIGHGKFIPTLIPNEYKAHPVTIRAMRKEIFMGETDFVDLECLYVCHSCKTEIDKQFWHFCPFCESSFK